MKCLKIAVVVGGDSSEREVSLRSGAATAAALDRDRFDPTIVDVSRGGWVTADGVIDKNDFSVGGVRFDYALVMIHGTPGENGILQGYFELLGIPYSTCDVGVSALTFNKTLCKAALHGTPGMCFSREVALRRGDVVDARAIVDRLGLPLFVKPNQSGSSCGVSKVKRVEDLLPAIDEAFKESDMVLCEEFIDGVEISQGVMICEGKEFVLPITELVSHNEFFDYKAKYTGQSDEITPARLSQNIARKVSEATLAAYKRLGCRGVVRVDYIVKGETPYFIEVNTVPGMSEASIIPQQWAAAGLTMGDGLSLIIGDAQ